MDPAPRIRLRGIGKHFGTHQVLQGIDLDVAESEWVGIVGPSGCGKSTLLALLGGHETADAGTLEVRGRVRTLFQSDALFPWLTVAQNVALGLRHVTSQELKRKKLAELLATTGLAEHAHLLPHELSGGMRQRAQCCWALASQADVVLFDEPLTALDFLNKVRLRRELVNILEPLGVSVVLVTHDLSEAASLADRVLVMAPNPGRFVGEYVFKTKRLRAADAPETLEATRRLMDVMESVERTTQGGNSRPRERHQSFPE